MSTQYVPGCFCGCSNPDECVTNRPVPAIDDRTGCCGQLSLEELAQASLNGWNCWRTCVAKRLREGISS